MAGRRAHQVPLGFPGILPLGPSAGTGVRLQPKTPQQRLCHPAPSGQRIPGIYRKREGGS